MIEWAFPLEERCWISGCLEVVSWWLCDCISVVSLPTAPLQNSHETPNLSFASCFVRNLLLRIDNAPVLVTPLILTSRTKCSRDYGSARGGASLATAGTSSSGLILSSSSFQRQWQLRPAHRRVPLLQLPQDNPRPTTLSCYCFVFIAANHCNRNYCHFTG